MPEATPQGTELFEIIHSTAGDAAAEARPGAR